MKKIVNLKLMSKELLFSMDFFQKFVTIQENFPYEIK